MPRYLYLSLVLFLFQALEASAKITLPVDNSSEQFEIPRSQIQNYIQRGTIEENLKPIRQVKPQSLADDELLSIPSKYLSPELRLKQNQLRQSFSKENENKKASGTLKSSDYVTIGRQGDNAMKLKLEETVWAANEGGRSKAVLVPQKRLPDVELLKSEKAEAGQAIQTELEPGDRFEIFSLFGTANSKNVPEPLMNAFLAYKGRDYASSTTLAFGVLTDKNNSEEISNKARYLLGHSLFQAGFYASALHQLIPLVTSKWRRSVLGMIAKGVEKTRDDAIANQVLSKVSLSQIPEKFRGTYSFHLGRVLLHTGAAQAALSAFSKVDEANPRYAEARYFSGVIVASEISTTSSPEDWNKEGTRPNQARVLFEEAQRLAQNQGARDLQSLSHLALGRLAYQLKQFNQSVFHYGEIKAESPFSKESTFETAWALYRLGEFNRSLGRLHPIGSPYYEGRDLAELWILRSLNYLKLCRFEEANTAANTFQATSNVVLAELRSALATLSNQSKFTSTSDLEKLDLTKWIQFALLQDPVVIKDKTRESLLDKEHQELNQLRKNTLVNNETLKQDSADSLQAVLSKKREAVTKALQPYLVERLKALISDYSAQKGKLDFLKFEIYSQATKFPDAIKRPQAQRLIAEAEFLPGVFLKGHEILWRFSGEYWLDEVAGYDYFIPTECSIEKKL